MGHVQDTPVSTSMISNVCMICHMKLHIVSYDLDQFFFSKSKNYILPNYEQMDLKEYQGMRLCTEKELANNVCCGTGCGGDARGWFGEGNLFCSIIQY